MQHDNVQISLAAARVNAGLTQEDVSKKLKITKATIINWESGKTQPRIADARKLSKLYNIPLDNIFLLQLSNEI